MYNSLTMKYYGRGAAKVIMPRAVLRENRNEWLIKPSMVILILAIACFFIVKATVVNNKKLFKQTKTIVLIPEAPPAPEPTVKKKIPLIKVLKTAVKKTIEPKKLELKKVTPKKLKPKLKPKTFKKPEIKKKQLNHNKLKLNKLDKKKLQHNKPLSNKLKKKELPKNKPTVNNSLKKRDIAKKLPATQPQVRKNMTAPKTTASLNKPLKTNKLNTPAPTFNGLDVKRKSSALPLTSTRQVVPQHKLPANSGPVPELTQWKPASKEQLSGRTPVAQAPGPRSLKHSAPVPEELFVASGSDNSGGVEEMVIIKSTALGNSDRVKYLKRKIMAIAENMSSRNSPYQYNVKGYKCTVIITSNNQVIIEFSPADASFEVVSALERMLHRQRF